MAALSLVVDLLVLLADRRNRGTLLAGHDDGAPLQAVLGVLAWARTAVAAADGGEEGSETGSRPSSAHRRMEDSPGSLSSINSRDDGKMAACLLEDRQPLLDALGMCFYLLSLDCTLSDAAAGGTGNTASQAARRIRRAILSHSECLQGILCLIRADPLTRRLRGTASTEGSRLTTLWKGR